MIARAGRSGREVEARGAGERRSITPLDVCERRSAGRGRSLDGSALQADGGVRGGLLFTIHLASGPDSLALAAKILSARGKLPARAASSRSCSLPMSAWWRAGAGTGVGAGAESGKTRVCRRGPGAVQMCGPGPVNGPTATSHHTQCSQPIVRTDPTLTFALPT